MLRFLIGILLIQASWAYGSEFSFKKLVTSSTQNGVNTTLSSECIKAVQEHISAGKSFSFPVLKKMLIRYGDINSEYRQKGVIYHYTNSKNMINIAENKNYDAIFLYLRSAKRQRNMDWNLYFAGDPVSSKGYGSILIKARIDENSFVFDPLIEYTEVNDQFEDYSKKIYRGIEESISKENPNLKACYFTKDTSVDNLPILVLLALEDSNVSLVAYYGLTTPQSIRPTYDAKYNVIARTPYVWYQLISPDYITELQYETSEK